MQASHKWMTLYFRCSGQKNVFGANPTVGWSSTLGGWSEPSPWNFRSSTSVDFLGKLSIFFPRVRIIMEQHFLVSSAGHEWVSVGWWDSLSPQLDSLSSSSAGFLWLMMVAFPSTLWCHHLLPEPAHGADFKANLLSIDGESSWCYVNSCSTSSPIQWLCHMGVNSY